MLKSFISLFFMSTLVLGSPFIIFNDMSQKQLETILVKEKIDYTVIRESINTTHIEYFEFVKDCFVRKRFSFLNNELVDRCDMKKYGLGTTNEVMSKNFLPFHIKLERDGDVFKRWIIEVNDQRYKVFIDDKSNIVDRIEEVKK